MPPIEIDSSEYNTLKRASADLIVANEQVEKLKETAENTKLWFEANRLEINKLKENITTLEETASKTNSEIETKYKDFDTIKESAEKWTAHNKKVTEARTANIEAMKTKLWKDFTDDDKDMINWMDESKVEKYLTRLLPEDKKPPSLKSSEDKGKKDPKQINERLVELETKKTNNTMSPTEKLEFLNLSSAETDSSNNDE